MSTDAVVGMMDGAYFVSRNEILSFFNGLLDLNLTKIEETASGAVACQLTEYIFPGSIPMSKVNWGAKASHEYVANYKLLQSAFRKHKVQRYVDVDKLIRGKYQDNLEFCQWLKAFHDQTSGLLSAERRDGYDPAAARAKGKGGKAAKSGGRGKATATGRFAAGTGGGTSRGMARTAAGGGTATTKRAAARPPAGGGGRPPASSAASKENNAAKSARSVISRTGAAATSRPANAAAARKYEERIIALKAQLDEAEKGKVAAERNAAEVEMNLVAIESERDFYFEKLRGIEVMLQVYREKEEAERGSGDVEGVLDRIFKVMYATMEDNVTVDDDGNLLGEAGVVVDSSISVDEGDFARAQDHDPEVDGGDAGDTAVGGAADDVDDDELLISDEGSPVAAAVPVVDQFSDDSDGELLTDGLDGDDGGAGASPSGLVSPALIDDDDIPDDDLLADD